MVVALEVLKLDKSKIDNDEQRQNMLFIFETREVLKLDKSNKVIFEQ